MWPPPQEAALWVWAVVFTLRLVVQPNEATFGLGSVTSQAHLDPEDLWEKKPRFPASQVQKTPQKTKQKSKKAEEMKQEKRNEMLLMIDIKHAVTL